jgi:hypothetical protein
MKRSYYITLIALLLVSSSFAQKSKKGSSITMVNDSIYHTGVSTYYYTKIEVEKLPYKGGIEHYNIFYPGSKDTLMVIIRVYGPYSEQCGLLFPGIKYRFNSPNWTLDKTLKIMIESGAIVNGVINVDELKTTCDKNNVKLMTYQEYDSWIKQATEAQAAEDNETKQKEASITIRNNSSYTANLKITYPDGTSAISIPANGVTTFQQGDKKGQMCVEGRPVCIDLPVDYFHTDKGTIYVKADQGDLSSNDW